MIVIRIALVTLLLLLPSTVFGGAAEEGSAVIDRWASVFSANDAEGVMKLYAPDAILLGTVSPIIAEGTEPIRAYFARLPGSGNKVVIGERRTIILADGVVVSAGFYEFTIMRDGKALPNPARFTMVLVKRGTDWLIVHHHSSARPKPPQ